MKVGNKLGCTPDTCPRCQGPFVCGVAGPDPCVCTNLTLSPDTQAELRKRYTGCLCLNCLRELAQPGVAVDDLNGAC